MNPLPKTGDGLGLALKREVGSHPTGRMIRIYIQVACQRQKSSSSPGFQCVFLDVSSLVRTECTFRRVGVSVHKTSLVCKCVNSGVSCPVQIIFIMNHVRIDYGEQHSKRSVLHIFLSRGKHRQSLKP